MKAVQTYRKNSAEWLGLKMEIVGGKRYYVKEGMKIRIQAWQPDIHYDQMFMMVDKLTEEGVSVNMYYEPLNKSGWFVFVGKCFSAHQNLRTAFRLACTEFKNIK